MTRAATPAPTRTSRRVRRGRTVLLGALTALWVGPAGAEGWDWRAETPPDPAATPPAAAAPEKAPTETSEPADEPDGGAVSGAIADIMAPNRPDAQARERDLEALRRRATSGVPR